MRRIVPAVVAAAALLLAVHMPAQQKKAAIAHTNLKVGEMAPDFTLLDTHFKPVKLSEFRGKKNVIVAFYVLAFTSG